MKLKGGGIGSPKWRNAGRPAEMPESPQLNEDQQADEALKVELHGKTAEELKAIAECDALRALIAQTRRPTRHATAVVSAAAKLLEFSSAKPAIATTVSAPGGGPVESRHEIVFVKPKEAE